MMMAVCFILFGLLFVIPFIPGIIEIRNKTDADPLYIDMGYHKDPCYFARSFKDKLLKSFNEEELMSGIYNLVLSKPETVEFVESAVFPDDAVIKNIYFAKLDLHSGNKAIFEKEVYVKGNASIGENNQLRALACDRDATIRKGTKLLRWLNAEGSITVEEDCDLGISVSSGESLSLASNCSFKRLYGFPVVAGNLPDTSAEWRKYFGADELVVFENMAAEREISHIPPHSHEDCSFVTINSLTIGDCALIRGHIKTHGSIATGSYVIIAGNLFAEGDIHLGPHSCVQGIVFAQGLVSLDEGVTVGPLGKIKSIIGKRGIRFGRCAKVYGYVSTEGEGCVV